VIAKSEWLPVSAHAKRIGRVRGSVASGDSLQRIRLSAAIGMIRTITAALFGGTSDQTANLFSDVLVHRMGTNLADGIRQGTAGPDESSTAPLWGVGRRIFFLHDGRTADFLDAINEHSSSGSEANGVLSNFTGLTSSRKQDILDFLRSL
jgi:CxxC motif-containing protein (DUF1111 family)